MNTPEMIDLNEAQGIMQSGNPDGIIQLMMRRTVKAGDTDETTQYTDQAA